MASKKGSKSSKTAHVLNVLSSPKQETGPEEEALDQLTDGVEDPVQEAAPSRPVRVPILEVARANDDALSEQIRDLLEQDWMEEEDVTPAAQPVPIQSTEDAKVPAQQPESDDSQGAAVPMEEVPHMREAEAEIGAKPPAPPTVKEAPPEHFEHPSVSQEAPPEPPKQPSVSQEAPPVPQVNPTLSQAPGEHPEAPREQPVEPVQRVSQVAEVAASMKEAEQATGSVEAVAESPKEEPTKGDKSLTYLECQDEFCHVNIMQALVEEKSLKYIQMFGLCNCSRCVADVKALALSNLPPKYLVMHKGQVVPMLSVYEGRFSSALTAQIINACKMVMENPRH